MMAKENKNNAQEEMKGEEVTSRIERKEGNMEKEQKPKKSKKGIVIGSAVGGVALVGALFAMTMGGGRAATNDFNVNDVLEEAYTAEVITDKEDEKSIVVIVGEDIDDLDTVKIVDAVKRDTSKETVGYAFKDEKAAKAVTGVVDFYTEGLLVSVASNEDGKYESSMFNSFPQIEADASAVNEWMINENESKTDENKVLNVVGTIGTRAEEKDIVAQLKGLSNMTDLYNPEAKYDSKHFEMQSGATAYEYNTDHENVLATTASFSIQAKD